jgi:hypothetical protein
MPARFKQMREINNFPFWNGCNSKMDSEGAMGRSQTVRGSAPQCW